VGSHTQSAVRHSGGSETPGGKLRASRETDMTQSPHPYTSGGRKVFLDKAPPVSTVMVYS